MSQQLPKWQADSAASKCYLCKTKFTFFNRRHHCRKCGQLVCATCSEKQVRYFSNSYVLNAQGTPQEAKSHTYYRTCDVCVDEICMIRETLMANSFARNSPEPLDAVSGVSAGEIDDASATLDGNADSRAEGASRAATGRAIKADGSGSRAPSGQQKPRGKQRVTAAESGSESDADMCPVCGVDLWNQFVGEPPSKSGASKTPFEPYKEAHVSQCLVTFDFASDNLRLSSPPNGSQTRNRMLVYNIPPIPEPSYETIENGMSVSNSTSVSMTPTCRALTDTSKALTDTSKALTDTSKALTDTSESMIEGGSGSARSNATFLESEKANLDEECVICLEDLRPGDKVGRLECLCVFHYKCIKDWFNKKSYAECPVHFLHK